MNHKHTGRTLPAPADGRTTDDIWRDNMQNAWAALRMIRETIETLGPPGILPSEEAVLGLHGPEPVHEATVIVEALRALLSKPAAAGRDEIARVVDWLTDQARMFKERGEKETQHHYVDIVEIGKRDLEWSANLAQAAALLSTRQDSPPVEAADENKRLREALDRYRYVCQQFLASTGRASSAISGGEE